MDVTFVLFGYPLALGLGGYLGYKFGRGVEAKAQAIVKTVEQGAALLK